MSATDHILTQPDILRDLREAAFHGYASGGIPKHADIIVGANATLLTFRSFGEGLPLKYADTLGQKFRAHMHSYERLWFYKGVCTHIHYQKGELVKQEPIPSDTPDGLLFRLGWEGTLSKDAILIPEAVKKVAAQVAASIKLNPKPAIWFNGEQVTY